MRYVIVGAGAIGSVLAAHLDDVVVVARGARLAALRANGLVVETPRGEIRKPVTVVDALCTGDVVCIATKTNDVAAVIDELARIAPRDTPVACFTNGLEAERIAAAKFDRVYGVYVNCSASHLDATSIQSYGTPVPGIFDVGPIDGVSIAIARDLERGGLRARAIADVTRWKRAKLVVNLANAVDAMCGIAARESELVAAIRDEGRRVFAAAKLDVTSDEEERARRGDLATASKQVGGSTWQSLARGVAIECDYFNGEIVRLGATVGVPTPLNTAILKEIASATAPNTRDIRELERSLLTSARFALE